MRVFICVAEAIEYGLLNFADDAVEGFSWHSWHVSPDNRLVRANQTPQDELQEEVKLCGCGPGCYERDAAGSVAPPVYKIAIFMLPGNATPTLEPKDAFQATYPRQYYKKRYVPSEGKTCAHHEVVC